MRIRLLEARVSAIGAWSAGAVVEWPDDKDATRLVELGKAELVGRSELESRAGGSTPTIENGGGDASRVSDKPDGTAKRAPANKGRTAKPRKGG